MDTNSVSTTALVLLAVLPTTVGGVVTAMASVLLNRRDERRVHNAWLLQERYQAYTALTQAMQNIASNARRLGAPEERGPQTQLWQAAYNKALLVSDENAKSHIHMEARNFWRAVTEIPTESTGPITDLRYELSKYLMSPRIRDKGPRRDFLKSAESPQD